MKFEDINHETNIADIAQISRDSTIYSKEHLKPEFKNKRHYSKRLWYVLGKNRLDSGENLEFLWAWTGSLYNGKLPLHEIKEDMEHKELIEDRNKSTLECIQRILVIAIDEYTSLVPKK